MPAEIEVLAVMLDTGTDPSLAAIVVTYFSFKRFSTREDMVVTFCVIVTVAAIREALNGVLAVGRSLQVTEFLVKNLKVFHEVSRGIQQEQVIGVIRIQAYVIADAVPTGKAGIVEQGLCLVINLKNGAVP